MNIIKGYGKDWVNKEQDLPNLNPKNVVIGFVEDNSGSVEKIFCCCYINGIFVIIESRSQL